MVVLGLLQNQWVRDPERLRALYARQPDQRRRYIGMLLFWGCLSGKRLRQALGDWCEQIIWENVSPEITSRPDVQIVGDPIHVKKAIIEVRPDLIIAFGAVARQTLYSVVCKVKIIGAPHPANRGADTMTRLRAVRHVLEATTT